MRRLLGISGKRFSGKDTLAGLLADAARARGVELGLHAFAAESKRLFVAARAAEAIDLARLTSDRDYKERWRPELTRFTVESLAADPLVFVRAVAARLEADPRPALITDLRLRLELDWLAPRFDLRVLRLRRPDAERARSGWRYDAAKDEHRTETELDDPSLWTEVVDNDGTIAELAVRAEGLLDRHLA